MLKSPPAQQQHTLALTNQFPEKPEFKNYSFESSVQDSCDADDDDDGDEVKVDTVLDLSCKKEEKVEEGRGVKRIREEEDGESGGKKVRVEGGGVKRKHLRKKRRDICAGGGSNGVVPRPSVITFAGVGDEGSTDSCDDEEEVKRKFEEFRRRRRKVFVRETDFGGFDVDEHFRRSLGEAWDKVAGGGGDKGNKEEKGSGSGGGGRIVIEDSCKPSDVDDHFAKALGSETWSKIIASSSNSSSNNTTQRQSTQPQRASPPSSSIPPRPITRILPPTGQPTRPVISTIVTPPPRILGITPPPVNITPSCNYKIDAILGNNTSSNRDDSLPISLVKREGGGGGEEGG